ncbi:MAG: MFS transporter [Pseudomonadota bacterium]
MSQQQSFRAGWWIVAFTFSVQFVSIGLAYYAFGVYLKPLSEALGADRLQISYAISIQAIFMALISPYAGKLLAEKSVKVIMIVGVASLALGLVLLSQITALWQLYLLFGVLVGTGMVLLGTIPANMLLANWFTRRRGTAMGISQFGVTISAAILVPTVTWLILTYDWRTAFLVCGIGTAILLLPMVFKFAIRAPEELGLHPDGDPTPPPMESRGGELWNFSRAIRSPDIWLITLIVGPCFMGIASIVLSLPAHITDLGLSPLEASSIVSITTFLGALAKPLFGILADHFNKRIVIVIAIVLQLIGVSILINVESYMGLATAGFFFGLGYGGMAPLWSIMLAMKFGRESFARVMGANMPLLMPFNLAGLPLTNYIFEQTGSYLPAFTMLLAGYVIAVIALFIIDLKATEPEAPGVENTAAENL